MPSYAAAIPRPPRTLTELEQATLLKVTGEHREYGAVDPQAVDRLVDATGDGLMWAQFEYDARAPLTRPPLPTT